MKTANKGLSQKGLSPIIIVVILAVVGIGAFVLLKGGAVTTNNSSSTPSSTQSNTSGNSEYYSPILGIKFKYASGWSVQDNYTKDSPIQVMVTKGTDADFRVLLPQSQPDGITMDKVNAGLIKTFSFSPGYKSVSESDVTVNGLSFHQLIFTSTQNNVTTKSLIIWTLKDGKTYEFGYNAKADQFDTLLPDAQTMINSIEIR